MALLLSSIAFHSQSLSSNHAHGLSCNKYSYAIKTKRYRTIVSCTQYQVYIPRSDYSYKKFNYIQLFKKMIYGHYYLFKVKLEAERHSIHTASNKVSWVW